MSDYCEARISHEILAGIWKTGSFPKTSGCPIKAELEFSEKILTGICKTRCFTNPLPTPDWSDFCNLLQKVRRTEPLAGHGKLDAREFIGFVQYF